MALVVLAVAAQLVEHMDSGEVTHTAGVVVGGLHVVGTLVVAMELPSTKIVEVVVEAE